MKTILLPTDFGKHSEKALEFAIQIARKSNAKIIVAHSFFISTMDVYVPVDTLQDIYEEEREDSEKELISYCQKIALNRSESGDMLQAEFVTEQNLPASEILHLIKEKKIDLVVMGTEGEDHLLGFLGSTTLEVLNKAKCPVLVVHEQSTFKEFHNIYFAIQEMKEDLLKIRQLIPLAGFFNGEISILHIDRFPEEMNTLRKMWKEKEESEIFLDGIKKRYNYPTIKFHFDISDNTFKKMDEVLEKDSPDLMVLVHKKRNWFENIFHKSVIKYLVKNTNTPLLIIH